MPDREKQTIKAPAQVGDIISAERVIVRCGYWHKLTECPVEALNEIALETMAARLEWDVKECERVVRQMSRYPNGDLKWSMWDEYAYPDRNRHLARNRKYGPLTDLYYGARRTWAIREARDDTPWDLRTLWYVDLEGQQQFQVFGKQLRMIGQPDGDEDGTYFWEHGRQTVYEVTQYSDGEVDKWIHPLDVMEET
jgi:hypothetical protein